MGTYLTNSKMSPALRARIQNSVRRSSRTRKPGLPLFMKTVLRATLVVVVLGGGGFLYLSWRQHMGQLDAARTALLAEVRGRVNALDDADVRLRADAQGWLLSASTKYEGDHVAPTLRTPEAVDELLSRPIVYVRGPVKAFQTPKGFERAVVETVDDSFVQCLGHPPEGRTESQLLERIEAPREVASFFRMAEAFTARPFASEAWTAQVLAASTLTEIKRLRSKADHADIGHAVLAAHAEVLVHLIDEPRAKGTLAEFDGASDHHLRIGIVDLTAKTTVVRLRRHVEPSWISEANRPYFARSLLACRLASEVRDALEDVPAH